MRKFKFQWHTGSNQKHNFFKYIFELRCDMEENKHKEAGIGPCATKKIGILVSSVLILRDVAVVVGIDVVLLVVALLTVQMRKCETVLQSLVSVPFRMDSPLIGDQVQEV